MGIVGHLSFKRRLVLVMTATSCAVLTIAFVVLLLFDRAESRRELTGQVAALAEMVGSNSAAAIVFEDLDAAQGNLAALRVHPNVVAAALYTVGGRPFATYRSDRATLDSIPPQPGREGLTFADGRVRLFRTIVLRDEPAGTIYLEADTGGLTERHVKHGIALLVFAIAGAAATFFAAARLQGLVSRPVLQLAAAAKEVADRKDYTVRVSRTGHDEIGDLTDAFNHMLGEIQRRDAALYAAQEDLKHHIRDLEQEMTERRQAQEALRVSEAQLRQAQKMEAVGTLAGGVAHDFNNLLQAMLAQTQRLRLGPATPEAVARLTGELEQQVMRGAGLTRQLLLFSRRETAKPEPVDLNAIVHEAARLLRRLIRENVAFHYELADLPLPVMADRGQLVQVIMNLAVNAADAMPDGGRLTLATGVEESRWVWLEVRDTGTGIPDEIRERIFEPFFTTKSDAQGTGLGLSVVHGIVTSHGGRISVTSRSGSGSVFRVALQRSAVAEAAKAHGGADAEHRLPRGHGERLLVVEDEAGAREALEALLTDLGYEVVAVGTGEAAGVLPAEPGFDLLLTDVMLPGLCGADLAGGLRDRWPELKIILMSGYADSEEVRGVVSSGKVRFLQKPFGMKTLAEELAAALASAG